MLLISNQSGTKIQGFERHSLADGSILQIWSGGYFFDEHDDLRTGVEIGMWLKDMLVSAPLKTILPKMNGCFSIVVFWEKEKLIQIGIDRYGFLPIYYTNKNQEFIVSDDYWELVKRIDRIEYNQSIAVSMVIVEYGTGYETLINGIFEFSQASHHTIANQKTKFEIISEKYWEFKINPDYGKNFKKYIDQIGEILELAFHRSIASILKRGWFAEVPLSSGIDSRLTVSLLNKYHVPIKAFSYGPNGNEETRYAGLVAEALGVEFKEVVIDSSCLTSELISTLTKRVGMKTRFTAGFGACIALEQCEPGMNNIFTPGHTGGFFYEPIDSRIGQLVKFESETIEQIRNDYFLPGAVDFVKSVFPNLGFGYSGEEIILANWRFDRRDPIGSMKRWELENRARRLILSEMRTYENYGHWLLPFFDHLSADFASTIPVEIRYKRKLYADAILNHFFTDDLAVMKTIPIVRKGLPKVSQYDYKNDLISLIRNTGMRSSLLRRGRFNKQRDNKKMVGHIPSYPFGPDPFDYWWYENAQFRNMVINLFRNWDGLDGLIDSKMLVQALERPMSPLFIRLGLPAFITFKYFENIVDDVRRNSLIPSLY